MTENGLTQTDSTTPSTRRQSNGRTPPGCRVLHVIVPTKVFNHVKAQAYLSGMRFPEYMVRLLEEAWAYGQSNDSPACNEAPAAPLA